MSPLVFISHSSEDRRAAERVCDALEGRGLGCWLASRDIGPGENFQEAIVKAIRSVRIMVLIFTGSANNSNEIKKEIALASQNQLAVIPLRIEDVVPSDAFVYELSTRQWIDAFDDWDRALGRLAEQIGGIVGVPPAPAPASSARPAASRLRPAVLWAAVVVLGLAAVGALAYRMGAGPAVSGAPGPVAAAKLDISGKWISGQVVNPYDKNQTSVLHFAFEQSGEVLLGSVTEQTERGAVERGIRDGGIKGDTIAFHTEGQTTAAGSGLQPYKDFYRGTIKGSEIDFIRQNDVTSGGVPQKFVVHRE